MRLHVPHRWVENPASVGEMVTMEPPKSLATMLPNSSVKSVRAPSSRFRGRRPARYRGRCPRPRGTPPHRGRGGGGGDHGHPHPQPPIATVEADVALVPRQVPGGGCGRLGLRDELLALAGADHQRSPVEASVQCTDPVGPSLWVRGPAEDVLVHPIDELRIAEPQRATNSSEMTKLFAISRRPSGVPLCTPTQ